MTSSSGPALLFDEAGRVGAGNGGMEVELLLCPKGEPGEKEEGESSFSVEMARSMLDLILARSVCARPMERSFRFKSLISSEAFSSSGVVVGGLTSPDKSMRLPYSAVTRMRRGSEDTCPDEAVVFRNWRGVGVNSIPWEVSAGLPARGWPRCWARPEITRPSAPSPRCAVPAAAERWSATRMATLAARKDSWPGPLRLI